MMPEAGAVMGLKFLADHGIEGYRYSWGGHDSTGRLATAGPAPARRRQPIAGPRGTTQAAEHRGLRQGGEMGQEGLRLFQGVRPAGHAGREPREGRKVPRGGPAAGRAPGQGQPRDCSFPPWPTARWPWCSTTSSTSKHFAESLPETEKPMPMIEPAIVVGISNAKLLKKGLGEYRAIVNGLIDAVRADQGRGRARRFPDSRAESRRRRLAARCTASRRPSSGASMRRSSRTSASPTRWPFSRSRAATPSGC